MDSFVGDYPSTYDFDALDRIDWFEDDPLEEDPLAALVDEELGHFSRRLIDPENAIFHSEVLSPVEFFNDRYYSGLLCDDRIWPMVKREMIEASSLKYQELILTGAQGTAKTTRCNGPFVYLAYLLSKMYDPCRTLGVLDFESLYMCFASTSMTKAEETGFNKFRSIIKSSQYFQDHCRPNPRVHSALEFPNGVIVKPIVTSEEGILSYDLIALAIDEANKLPKVDQSKKHRSLDETYDVARSLYKSARIRNRTRFMNTGRWWGKIALISETGYADDFLEDRIREVMDNNEENVFVSRKSLWEAKAGIVPPAYSKKTFRVECGVSSRQSRILRDDEVATKGATVLEPPIDFRSDFEKDLEGAIRKMGGVALFGVSPLITNRNKVHSSLRTIENRELHGYKYEDTACIHPFTVETTAFLPGEVLIRSALSKKDERSGAWTPIVNPEAWRAIHIDYGHRRDRCGIAMSHCAGVRTVDRRNAYNEMETIAVPDVYTDFALRIMPPGGGTGEILWKDIERLIEELVEIGFPIALITTDKAAGPVAIQELQRAQFDVELLSVDESAEPYLTLRQAYNEGRHSIYRYDPYLTEVLNLEWWSSMGKIDHKGGGAKDVADAVCGSVYACLTRLVDANPRGSSVKVMRF